MANEINLTDPIADGIGPVADAINGALMRGKPVVVAVVDEDGHLSQSLRGSTQVYSHDQIAIWARQRDKGLAVSIASHPEVSLFYFDPSTTPAGIRIRGRAHTDASLNDAVHAVMPEREQDRDPEQNGIAIIVDVDHVNVFGKGFAEVNQSR